MSKNIESHSLRRLRRILVAFYCEVERNIRGRKSDEIGVEGASSFLKELCFLGYGCRKHLRVARIACLKAFREL